MSSKKSAAGVRRGRHRVTVCIPDIHVPNEDKAAVTWALDVVRELRPDHVILLGDLVDFTSLSRFPKSPEQAAALQGEILAGRRLVRRIEQECGDARVTYLLGNHEGRHTKYLWKRAPELTCLPELAVPALLKVPHRWVVVSELGHAVDQGVLFMHGTRWSKSTCQANLADYGMSVVQGHSHRANLVHRRLPNGKRITAAEAGCLCQFDQGYSTFTNWCHAVVVVRDGRVELVVR